MAMKQILEKLNLGTLIEKFEEQRMDPTAVTAMSSSDGELSRLGVTTIADRIRLAEVKKEKVMDSTTASLEYVVHYCF